MGLIMQAAECPLLLIERYICLSNVKRNAGLRKFFLTIRPRKPSAIITMFFQVNDQHVFEIG